MATISQNPDQPQVFTFNQFAAVVTKSQKRKQKKDRKMEREAKKEVAWMLNPEVNDIRLLGERFDEPEEEFVSTWDISQEIDFTPLPASWIANRIRFNQWKEAEARRMEQSMSPNPTVRAVAKSYKKGVSKCFGAVRNFFLRHKLTQTEQTKADAIVEAHDNPEGELGDELEEHTVTVRDAEVVRRKPRHGNPLWWVKYAAVTRSEHPLLSDTPAMRRTVHRFALDLMKADKVTRTDAAKVIDMVVETCYVPTASNVEAAKFRESKIVRQRMWDVAAPYWSYWWGVRRRGQASD